MKSSDALRRALAARRVKPLGYRVAKPAQPPKPEERDLGDLLRKAITKGDKK